MKRIAFILYVLSCLMPASAQERRDTFATPAALPQLLQYAREHQPLIAQSALDEQIAAANIRSRLADWYPQIGGAYSLQHNFQRPTSVFNGNATPVGTSNTSTAQLNLSQAIFNRDLLLANRTQGDIQLQARQVTSSRKIDLSVAVSKAFYDIITTHQQIRVADENRARLQRSLDDAFYRYKAGVVDKTDYKRAQIALNNTVATRRGYETSEAAKIEYLRSLLGYPADAPLAVSYDSMQMERDVLFDTLQRPDATKRIEYQLLTTQRRLQETNVRYQRNAFLPTVSANAVYNLNYLNNRIGKLYSDNFPNSFVGLSAGIPIFQGGKRRSNVRAAQLALARVDLDLENLANTVNSQYAAALASYQGSLANYRSSRENILLAREVYDVLQLQYRAGIRTYFEVISAETDLHNAQINYFNALNQVLASKVEAQRSLGLISE